MLGSASAIKVNWPILRDLPGDCGTANLRSESLKVEARVVRSVMMRAGGLYLVGLVEGFSPSEALRTISIVWNAN